ncbi:hypothetical protein GS426_16745 [Rhodococcus hoagii]|nr:hypothetical protein [Prescottella equi]
MLVFTQVRRDNARGEELARLLGCKFEAWPEDVTHTEQEARVRALMRSARAVVSDRIHALIMGTTEGALPIGLIPSDDSKVGSHLRQPEFTTSRRIATEWGGEPFKTSLPKSCNEARNSATRSNDLVPK